MLVAACSGRGGGHAVLPTQTPAATMAWTPTRTAARDDLPVAPPFVAPGERMSYRVNAHGIDVASYVLVVGDIVDVGGHRAVVVQSGVESSSLVSLFKKVADTFTSWIDVSTGRPVLFRAEELASKQEEIAETVEASFHQAANGRVPIKIRRADLGDVDELQAVPAAALHDLNSFLVVLRGWDAPPGTQATADVLRSRFVWRTQLTVGGYETVSSALGPLPCVRFDGLSRRLTRAGELDPKSDTRYYSIWISDDADRVPVRMVAHADYGDIIMELADYQPGSQARIGNVQSGAQLGSKP